GAQIAFVASVEGKSRLHLMAADGTNVRRIAGSLEVATAPSWSPDGRWIAVGALDAKATSIFKVPADGGAPVRLVEGGGSGGPRVRNGAVWSPDGRFILYGENQGGPVQLLRGMTPDGKPIPLHEVRVTFAGGNRYRFLPSGKEIVVLQGLTRAQNFFRIDLE